jgi:hypothetical protein
MRQLLKGLGVSQDVIRIESFGLSPERFFDTTQPWTRAVYALSLVSIMAGVPLVKTVVDRQAKVNQETAAISAAVDAQVRANASAQQNFSQQQQQTFTQLVPSQTLTPTPTPTKPTPVVTTPKPTPVATTAQPLPTTQQTLVPRTRVS